MRSLNDFFFSGRAADLVLVVMLLEGLTLWGYHRRTGRGLKPMALIKGLLPGACLVLAVRAALVGAWWGWIALALSASLLAHLADLQQRWAEAR